jgi:hypothetical protein
LLPYSAPHPTLARKRRPPDCARNATIFKPRTPFKKPQKSQEAYTESVYVRTLPERRK